MSAGKCVLCRTGKSNGGDVFFSERGDCSVPDGRHHFRLMLLLLIGLREVKFGMVVTFPAISRVEIVVLLKLTFRNLFFCCCSCSLCVFWWILHCCSFHRCCSLHCRCRCILHCCRCRRFCCWRCSSFQRVCSLGDCVFKFSFCCRFWVLSPRDSCGCVMFLSSNVVISLSTGVTVGNFTCCLLSPFTSSVIALLILEVVSSWVEYRIEPSGIIWVLVFGILVISILEGRCGSFDHSFIWFLMDPLNQGLSWKRQLLSYFQLQTAPSKIRPNGHFWRYGWPLAHK